MRYNYRYRLKPTDELHERLAWTVDTCRQVYNHFLHRLNRVDGTSAYSEQSLLPDLKREWAFPPVDVMDAPSATIEARPEMSDDDDSAHDPYAYGPAEGDDW